LQFAICQTATKPVTGKRNEKRENKERSVKNKLKISQRFYSYSAYI